MFKKVILLILIILNSIEIFSQYPLYKFNNISSKDGLSDDYTEAILQDRYGFIWIGSRNGLTRYDGYNTKIYRKQINNNNSLTSNFVYRLFEDSSGRLWIGTLTGGLLLYNREYDNFEKVIIPGGDKRKSIFSISEDIDSTLWIGTYKGAVNYNPYTKKIIPYDTTTEAGKIIHTNRILAILTDSDKNLWITTQGDAGVVMFDRKNDTSYIFKHIPHDPYSLKENNCIDIVQDKNGIIFLAYISKGVDMFDSKTKTFHQIQFSKTNSNLKSMWKLMVDSQNRLWCSAVNEGLFIVDNNKEFTQVKNDAQMQSTLTQTTISSMIEDFNGNIWLGIHGGGVDIINKRKNIFKHFYKLEGRDNLSHNFISSFAEDENGNIWIGTDGGGLYSFNPQNNKFVGYDTSNYLPNNSITDVKIDKNGFLWLATWGNGMIKFNPKTNQTTIYEENLHDKLDPSYITCNRLKDLFIKNNKIHIATHDEGFTIFDIKNETFINKSNNPFDFSITDFGFNQKVFIDSKNRIWIGTINGLFKIEDNKLQSYFFSKENDNSIANDFVDDIFEDSNGDIWFAHNFGFDKYIDSIDGFDRIGNRLGVDMGIKAITQDHNKTMWFTSNNGLLSYNTENDKLKHFTIQDGLQGNQFFERAAYTAKNGLIYVGGLNGFNIIDTINCSGDTTAPKLYFTALKINDTLQLPGALNSILKRDLNFTEKIILNYDQRNISIDFVALHFASFQKNKYNYKLKGYDKTWKSTSIRTAIYTNLDPGEYEFVLQATSDDGKITDTPKSLKITILPPWWKTIWFNILIILFVLGVFFLIIRLRTANVQRQNKILEKKVEERTKELNNALSLVTLQKEEIEGQNNILQSQKSEILIKNQELIKLNNTKNKFFSIIAHDLKSPLNALIGFSDLLVLKRDSIEKQKQEKYIKIINKSSKNLYALLENLLSWARSQINAIKINLEVVSVNEICFETFYILENDIKSKKITIHSNISPEIKLVVDKTLITTVFRNIIANAIKYTPEEGIISIHSYNIDENVYIEFEDSGVGMTEKQIENIFLIDKGSSTPGTNKEQGTGLGLILCKEFVDLHNGKILVKSEINKGSKFTIVLPSNIEQKKNQKF